MLTEKLPLLFPKNLTFADILGAKLRWSGSAIMIRIRGTLLPEHILLNITPKSREEAVQQLAESLRSDTRISDWQEFLRALRKHEAAGKVNLEYGLTLPHIRNLVSYKYANGIRTARRTRSKKRMVRFNSLCWSGSPEPWTRNTFALSGL